MSLGRASIVVAALAGVLVAGVVLFGARSGLEPAASAALAGFICAITVVAARLSTAAAPPEPSAPSASVTLPSNLPPKGDRETLLRAVVEHAPMAVLVYGDTGRISYSNVEARELFFEGRPLDGENFLRLVELAPEALKDGLTRQNDALFTVEKSGGLDTYTLARRALDLDGEPHTLLMVKQLTPELDRQEVEVWKKVIRIINHELNNSLAPISSMVHSARLIAQNPEQLAKLDRVFDTIEERTQHLAAFLEGYARFARLPRPRAETVSWPPFLDSLRSLYPDVSIAEAPAMDGFFDRGQLQQVAINLLKNAIEASNGAEGVALSVTSTPNGESTLSVVDRGSGMTDEVLQSALVPYFSTKAKGTGLGLALCREIIEAHRGKLSLSRRDGGGIEVSCWLPGRAPGSPPRTGRLTLTRA